MSGSAVAKAAEERAMNRRGVGCVVVAACLVFALVNGQQQEKIAGGKNWVQGAANDRDYRADEIMEESFDMETAAMIEPSRTARMQKSSVRTSFAKAEARPYLSMDEAAAPVHADPEVIPEKMLIRRADLQIVTKVDVFAVARAAAALIEGLGGHVENSRNENTQGSSRKEAWLLLRVPAGKYEAALKALTIDGIAGTSSDDVESVAQSSSDVTAEYVDAAARLKTLEAARDQLYQLMTKAASVQDVLSVRRELTRVTQDLEARQSRLNYLSKQTDLATIDLTIRSQRRSHPSKPPQKSLWNRLVLRRGLSWPQFILRRFSRAIEVVTAITGLIIKSSILLFIYASFVLPLAAILYFSFPLINRFMIRPLQRLFSLLLDLLLSATSSSTFNSSAVQAGMKSSMGSSSSISSSAA